MYVLVDTYLHHTYSSFRVSLHACHLLMVSTTTITEFTIFQHCSSTRKSLADGTYVRGMGRGFMPACVERTGSRPSVHTANWLVAARVNWLLSAVDYSLVCRLWTRAYHILICLFFSPFLLWPFVFLENVLFCPSTIAEPKLGPSARILETLGLSSVKNLRDLPSEFCRMHVVVVVSLKMGLTMMWWW